jgi:hypothetical protein
MNARERGSRPVLPVDAEQATDIPAAAVAALHNGKLIDAVKHTRTATGLGLKDSKEAVERYLDAHPATRQRLSEASRPTAAIRFVLVATIFVIAAAVLFKLLRGP